ncbi:VOC family protein [Lewinella sp. IMCC34183]|uniref:VOC family protein n=1 Tax=Lewinella sp. IMCC34183 TaxID=2248762 RepID=UPI000E2675B6|nr:VOC family protein [Lewinella sp. IMCC34183]
MNNLISTLDYPERDESSVFQDVKGWHVAIRTTHFEGLIAWYQDKLDFRMVKAFTAGEMQLALIAPPGDNDFLLEVLGVTGSEVSSSKVNEGYDHVCFSVANLEETMAALKLRNIKIDRSFEVPVIGKRVAFISDPFGNTIEFAEALRP